MSYKPKYCCQCGEKVERLKWRFWTNRRFCELCALDFGYLDLLPQISLILGLFLSIFAIANLWRKPERNLVISPETVSAYSQISNKNFVSLSNTKQNSNAATVQTANVQQDEEGSNARIKQSTAAFKQNGIDKRSMSQVTDPANVVYFCGAQTKKGTPCTRRVKNGGRCWQHSGQPAMLPPEKLIAKK